MRSRLRSAVKQLSALSANGQVRRGSQRVPSSGQACSSVDLAALRHPHSSVSWIRGCRCAWCVRSSPSGTGVCVCVCVRDLNISLEFRELGGRGVPQRKMANESHATPLQDHRGLRERAHSRDVVQVLGKGCRFPSCLACESSPAVFAPPPPRTGGREACARGRGSSSARGAGVHAARRLLCAWGASLTRCHVAPWNSRQSPAHTSSDTAHLRGLAPPSMAQLLPPSSERQLQRGLNLRLCRMGQVGSHAPGALTQRGRIRVFGFPCCGCMRAQVGT